MSIDFICVGAQKAATTWLYKNLVKLPDFDLPPIKELHYFDRSHSYPSRSPVAEDLAISRLINRKNLVAMVKDFGRVIVKDYYDFNDLKFLLRWHSMKMSDYNYARIFNETYGKSITGELTPSYAYLRREDFIRMRDINPNIKILYILRNPIERAWSHARFVEPSIIEDENRLFRFFESYKFRNHGNYIESIATMESVFSLDQIKIIWFDNVLTNPQQTMKTVVSFVGGDEEFVDQLSGLNVPVNVSTKMKMPKGVELRLKSIYHDMMHEMAVQYESAPRKWYNLYFNEDGNSG